MYNNNKENKIRMNKNCKNDFVGRDQSRQVQV